MLFAFLSPLLHALAALNGAWHVLLIILPPLVFFTAGYAWRHFGNGWLWFTVPWAASLTPMVPAMGVAKAAVPAPPSIEIDAIEHLATAIEAAQKQTAQAEADAKARAAKAEAQRAKLAAAASTLTKTV